MKKNNFFITGIGTDVGKTLSASVLVRILGADYWKPVQMGTQTDSERVALSIAADANVWDSVYHFPQPISPHDAARKNGSSISLDILHTHYLQLQKRSSHPLLIEGAGGVCTPLTQTATNVDLMRKLACPIILVSASYLGSINHSLLSFEVLRAAGLSVKVWIFCGYTKVAKGYESDICEWTNTPALLSLPAQGDPRKIVTAMTEETKNETRRLLLLEV